MSITDNPEDFLTQNRSFESHPSFKFTARGDTCEGSIIDKPRVVETDDLDGGRSKKLVLGIETAEGPFLLWLPAQRRITSAIADAVIESGATELLPGGVLKVAYTGDGEASRAGFNAPKLFRARYTPPAPVSAEPFDLDEF